jgi:hypothetical protein
MKSWVQTYHKSNTNFKKLKVYILYLCEVEYPSFCLTCLTHLMFIHSNCFQIFNELKTGMAD